MDKMRERAQAYVDAGLITDEVAQRIISVILSERNHEEYLNEVDGNGPPEDSNLTTKLTHEQMKSLLAEREALMQKGAADGEVTDQWRVYQHVIGCIERNEYLRCMIQASAGTGKSFLLTSIFLWCLVHKLKCKAAAPTGIAAANVEIPKTDVSATTLHAMFEFDGEYKTRMDFAKLTNQKVQALLQMQVLLLALEKETASQTPHSKLFY